MSRRVLVVDDEATMRAAMAQVLIRRGHAVEVCGDAESALSCISRRNYDVVISDLRMPEIDGHELLRRVRALQPEIAMILVTAYGTVESAVQCVRDGASNYLLKPFSPEQLARAVEDLLGGDADEIGRSREPVVGPGKVRARATVELETARVERVEERFDPDGVVVRSEQRNKARSGPAAPAGGVPGTDSNLPQGSPAGDSSSAGSQTQASTTNFEINKTVSKIAEPRGRLLRQSVAVVLDHGVELTENEDGTATEQTAPRSEEEMAKITALVRAAVGIDEGRGDSLIVENIPFDNTLHPAIETGGLDWIRLITESARYLALPLAVLLVVLFVIRPGLAALRGLRAPAEGPTSVQTVAELQAQIAQGVLPAESAGSPLRRKLIEAAAEDPEAAALVIRGWMGKVAE